MSFDIGRTGAKVGVGSVGLGTATTGAIDGTASSGA